jgi:hypothetical protein
MSSLPPTSYRPYIYNSGRQTAKKLTAEMLTADSYKPYASRGADGPCDSGQLPASKNLPSKRRDQSLIACSATGFMSPARCPPERQTAW